MHMRTYQIEQSEDVLTIRAVDSQWRGLRVAEAAYMVMPVVTLVTITASFFVPNFEGFKLFAIACFWLSSVSYDHFGPWKCVLDSKTDEVLRNGTKGVKFSEVVAAHYDGFLYADKGRGVSRRKALYLELTNGRKTALRKLFITRCEDAAMEDAATRINAFLAERRQSEARHRPMIWSWEQGKNVPA
ncbi:MAG: hypothetical protein JWQ02_929 [Capsulimonas sp.]|nr:hypothetical protein [Capsulimonas sp.]